MESCLFAYKQANVIQTLQTNKFHVHDDNNEQ